MDEILKKRSRGISPSLKFEWADKRDAAWTPRKALAKWRCAEGHRYSMSIQDRERADRCPRCAGVKKTNAPAPLASHSSGAFLVGDGNFLEYVRLQTPASVQDSRRTHHILVLDRSGSMCGDIMDMRSVVIKLITADELRRNDAMISVISYSSDGDVVVHAQRIRAADFDAISLAGLVAGGLTSISGGLRRALGLINPVEITAISLHSDGYANDPSPAAEIRACISIVGQIRDVGAILNTVAHRDSADRGTLVRLANLGGGACARAGNLGELHAALWRAHTQPKLAPSRVKILESGSWYLLRIGAKSRKVTLEIRTGTSDVDVVGNEEVYQIKEGGDKKAGGDPRVALAFARGLIGLGRLTAAKKTALATGFSALDQHRRAMTSPEIAALSDAIEKLIFDVNWDSAPPARGKTSGEAKTTGLVLGDVLAALAEQRDQILVHTQSLLTGYTRRGLKRVPGTWVDDKIIPPVVTADGRRSESQGCDLISVDQNHQSATMNITVSQPIELVRDRKRVLEVGGISLENLRQYRSFTVVSDGELLIDELRLKVRTAGAWEVLKKAIGGPFGAKFDHDRFVDLDLTQYRLVQSEEPPPPSGDLILKIMRLTAMQRLVSASLTDGSGTPYTPEQIAALREVHVTPNLHFSPPTCYPYLDLKRAQIEGKVDSRTRHGIRFGAHGVMVGDLRSANEMIRRRYEVVHQTSDDAVENPTARDFFDPALHVTNKPLSKRMAVGEQDSIEHSITEVARVCRSVGPRSNLWTSAGLPPMKNCQAELFSPESRAYVLRVVEVELERCWTALRDPVMAIGASGCVPDSWGVAHDAVWAASRGYKVGKALADATFYELPNEGVVAVSSETSLYSVSWENSKD